MAAQHLLRLGVIFSLYFSCISAEGLLYLEEGSRCAPVGAVSRSCKRLADCPQVQAGLQQRVFTEICSFKGNQPVVCCPDLQSSRPTVFVSTAPPLPSLSLTRQGEGEVCQDGFQRWYCRRHTECPGIREAIRRGLPPKICTFKNGQPIVCCPAHLEDENTAPATRPTSRPNWPSWTRPQTTERWTQSWTTEPPRRTSVWQEEQRPVWGTESQRPGQNWPSWTRPSQPVPVQTQPPQTERPSWQPQPWEPQTERPSWQQQPWQPPTSAGVVGAKADRMCKKYAKYVFMNVSSPTLAIDDEVIEESFCGRITTPLIVNGVDAGPREFPHMARIGYGDPPNIMWLCGGSLISERYILSAAHCTKPQVGTTYKLAKWANLGDLNVASERDEAAPVTIRIVERYDHPDYQSGKHLYHDIALYKLERDAPLGIYVRPICLNTRPSLRENVAIASGWGHTFFQSSSGGSDMLKKVDLKLVPSATCNNHYRSFKKELPQGVHSEYMICAGGHDGKDTCQGDSGGPLQIALREPYCMYSIIGVTSFGRGCGSTTPGVYTRVAHYIQWIESIVWPT